MLQHAPRACPSPDRDGFGPGGSSGGNFSSTFHKNEGIKALTEAVQLALP